GRVVDIASGRAQADADSYFIETHPWVLLEDPIFEEALVNPTGMALARYLLTRGAEPPPHAGGDGTSLLLRSHDVLLKGQTDRALDLHCDNADIPAPFPQYQQICNVTWCLTNYHAASGGACFVPGSHRWCRHPDAAERTCDKRVVAVDAMRGAMIVW